MADGDFVDVVVSVVNALELKDHLNKQAKTLSAGLKRKVRTNKHLRGKREESVQVEVQPRDHDSNKPNEREAAGLKKEMNVN